MLRRCLLLMQISSLLLMSHQSLACWGLKRRTESILLFSELTQGLSDLWLEILLWRQYLVTLSSFIRGIDSWCRTRVLRIRLRSHQRLRLVKVILWGPWAILSSRLLREVRLQSLTVKLSSWLCVLQIISEVTSSWCWISVVTICTSLIHNISFNSRDLKM